MTFKGLMKGLAMERGVERLNDDNELVFAIFETTMPDIAKLDAIAAGFVAEPNDDDGAYSMQITGDEMAEDMADTFEWMDEAGLLAEYDEPAAGETISFTLTGKALEDLGIR